MSLARRKIERDAKLRRYQRDQRLSMAVRVACGKLAFLSKEAAKHYVRSHLAIVKRVYRCRDCGNWHTTSQAHG